MKKKKKLYSIPSAIGEKWVKALRSGKYKQGNGSLIEEDEHGNKKYCCLGVLGEILECKMMSDGMFLDSSSMNSGLENVPEVLNKDKYDQPSATLARLNDGTDGVTRRRFKGIAQWIERNIAFV